MAGISNNAIIAVGIVALCLCLFLLGLLISWLIRKWKMDRSRIKYKQVVNKYDRTKHGQFVVPKLSTTFPTTPFKMQFSESPVISEDEEQSPSPKKKVSFDFKHALPKTRKNRMFGKESLTLYDLRRNRRVFSDSDILLSQRDKEVATSVQDIVKPRASSETGEKRGKIRRSRSRSALRALAEISGQIEYTIFYDSSRQKLIVEVIQVLDINEITPDLFLGRCEIIDLENISFDVGKPCLIRDKDGTVSFSKMSELRVYVQVTMFPRKKLIGTTQYKHGNNSLIFNERFVLDNRKIEDISGCSVRFQVLLSYGRHRQDPVIIGETVTSLKNIKRDVIIPFTDYLKMPVDEDEFESSLSEDSNLGQLVVSVRYQLLRQVLTIRIEKAIGLPKMGIQGLPSSSVKVHVYQNNVAILKRTTEIVRKTCKPNFKQSFDIDLAQNKLNQVGILLQVRLHGTVYRSVLGYVHIGPAAEGPGKEHWDQVLSFSDFNSESAFDITSKKPNHVCLPS